ncbi:hypothetical protein As57867_005087, partial [Aphanomyces stellatus]
MRRLAALALASFFLAATPAAAVDTWPHLFDPCRAFLPTVDCPDACILDSLPSQTNKTATCFRPSPMDGNVQGRVYYLARTNVKALTLANSTANSTLFLNQSQVALEHIDLTRAPNIKTMVFVDVKLAADDIQHKWSVGPHVSTLLLFHAGLTALPNLTRAMWPSLDFFDVSKNLALVPLFNQDVAGEIALQYPFLQGLTGLGLSNLSLTTVPKFIFRLPKLDRIYLRNNSFDAVSLTPDEYVFLTHAARQVKLHTFNETHFRDTTTFESLPQCPATETITLLYRGTSGHNWFICLTGMPHLITSEMMSLPLADGPSAVDVVAHILAWIILVTMTATPIYLVGMRWRNRHVSPMDDADDALFRLSHLIAPPTTAIPGTFHTIIATDDSSFELWLTAGPLQQYLVPVSRLYVDLQWAPHNSSVDNVNNDDDDKWHMTLENNPDICRGSFDARPVLVKRLRGSDLALRIFAKQLEHLSRFHHPQITDLVGVAYDDLNGTLALVCANPEGLVDLKQAIPHLHATKMQSRVAIDIAAALRYLHGLPQVHGNLSTTTVVVDATSCHARLNRLDILPCDVSTLHHQALYVAPEVLSGASPPTAAADVYSFGMLLAELDTGESAYHFLNRSARCMMQTPTTPVAQLLPLRHALTFNRG